MPQVGTMEHREASGGCGQVGGRLGEGSSSCGQLGRGLVGAAETAHWKGWCCRCTLWITGGCKGDNTQHEILGISDSVVAFLGEKKEARSSYWSDL